MSAPPTADPPHPAGKRITATHLYEFALCEHRVALDFTLDRSLRTPPDEAARLLFERGRAIEERIASGLGYATVAPRPGDPEGAFRETLDLMRRGVPGIYQGVLLAGRRLAIPDLLRRADGASSLGGHHYVPGDIKSGLEPRTDQALQVVFSARLLEEVQGRLPECGFLLLADGEESVFPIGELVDSFDLAHGAVAAIADGGRATFPFFSEQCARCRWKGTCLPALQEGDDLSFVAGMTRTRKRLLAARGIGTVKELAALDDGAIEALAAQGFATEGLRRLRQQALALASGRAEGAPPRRRREPPGRGLRQHFLAAAWDPLGGGEPFLVGYASRPSAVAPFDRLGVRLARSDDERAALLPPLVSSLGAVEQAVLHFGPSAPRAFDRIADLARFNPAEQGKLEARFFDLAPVVRAGAYLPVRRYRLDEIAAALAKRAATAARRAGGRAVRLVREPAPRRRGGLGGEAARARRARARRPRRRLRPVPRRGGAPMTGTAGGARDGGRCVRRGPGAAALPAGAGGRS